MTETQGFGDLAWLPPVARRALQADSRREAREASQEQRARDADRAARRDQAIVTAHREAVARGQDVAAMSLIDGTGLGRSLNDVIADVTAAADREDARAAARRRARGEREEDVAIFVAEPRIARTEPILTRRQLYLKRLCGKFKADNPQAGVVERAMFRQAAARTWKP